MKCQMNDNYYAENKNIEISADQIEQNKKQNEQNEKRKLLLRKWVTRKISTNNDHAAVYIDEKRGNNILLVFSFKLWRVIWRLPIPLRLEL